MGHAQLRDYRKRTITNEAISMRQYYPGHGLHPSSTYISRASTLESAPSPSLYKMRHAYTSVTINLHIRFAELGILSTMARPKRKRRSPPICVPVLRIPLSKLAQQSIVQRDIKKYVTRPAEIRKGEVAMSGKIKRPLNTFMLYRKAYQDVAKALIHRHSGENFINPRISKLCGFSWRTLEPETVKCQFERWAMAEKTIFESAFPNYHYTPRHRSLKPTSDFHRRSSIGLEGVFRRPNRTLEETTRQSVTPERGSPACEIIEDQLMDQFWWLDHRLRSW